MNKIALSILLAIFGLTLFAQTQFEGKVTHTFITERENETGTIEVFYGNQKIKGLKKIKGKENENGTDDLVIDFTKGILYKINAVTKTYSADTFINKKNTVFGTLLKLPGKNKTILDHSCSAFTITGNGKNEFMGEMDFLFWYADSLYFTIDEKYLQSDEVTLFTNGKTIGMGISVTTQAGNIKQVFELIPAQVEPMHLPDSLFEIPGDYTVETVDYRTIISDSAITDSAQMMMMKAADSAVKIIAAAEELKKKTPHKPVKNKAGIKSAATRRKE
ncbi:hypothetical protein [Ferruginibacter sp. SUN106]|uniref:hypothetical protein n=1 Tax=Ferruginibacter sp. SUN106 TaxID=2978348 RepID=UPI003D36F599